jgi:hypothetical protein
MTLDEVIAREAIRELAAAYAHAADGGCFDDFLALFTPDGSLQVDDREPLVGPAAIRAFVGGTQASVQTASKSAPRGYIRHNVTSHTITLDGPDDAHGAAYFFVVTERGPDHWGRYRDRYVRRDGRWLFASRKVRVDGVAPGSWAAERRAR